MNADDDYVKRYDAMLENMRRPADPPPDAAAPLTDTESIRRLLDTGWQPDSYTMRNLCNALDAARAEHAALLARIETLEGERDVRKAEFDKMSDLLVGYHRAGRMVVAALVEAKKNLDVNPTSLLLVASASSIVNRALAHVATTMPGWKE